MRAWHFVGDTLRDGSPIPPIGEKLVFNDKPILCQQGLHASIDALDALKYAPGNTLCLVECGGTLFTSDDKLVCTERTIIAMVDANAILREFARWCALSVANLWNIPTIVLNYLHGDTSLRPLVEDVTYRAILHPSAIGYVSEEYQRHAADSAVATAHTQYESYASARLAAKRAVQAEVGFHRRYAHSWTNEDWSRVENQIVSSQRTKFNNIVQQTFQL